MTMVTRIGQTQLYREWEAVVKKRLPEGSKTTPSGAAIRVILCLYKNGPLWGSEIARRTNAGQSNTTKLTLPRLQEMGLVECEEQTNPRGGRPLHIWRLTEKGRDIGIIASVESGASSGLHSAERSSSVPSVRKQKRRTGGGA
jgi:DNA-binding MarR family transcriptional regulator